MYLIRIPGEREPSQVDFSSDDVIVTQLPCKFFPHLTIQTETAATDKTGVLVSSSLFMNTKNKFVFSAFIPNFYWNLLAVNQLQ